MKRIKIGSGRALFAATIIGASFAAYAATLLLKDINPGANDSAPGFVNKGFALLGNRLVFAATTMGAPPGTDHGNEPWVTDGTVVGTVELADIEAGTGDSLPTNFTPFGGKLYFAATNTASGRELWSTNGTPVGTTQFPQEFNAGGVSGINDNTTTEGAQLGVANGELWLAAVVDDPFFGGALGTEPARFNGTRIQVIDVYPAADSNPNNFRGIGPVTAFIAFDGTTDGVRLFNASTVPPLEQDLAVLPAATVPFVLANLTDVALDDGVGAVAPKAPNNTCLINDPADAMVHGGKLYFSAEINGCTTNALVDQADPLPDVPGNAITDFGRELLVWTPNDPSYPYTAGDVLTATAPVAGYARLVEDINPMAGDGLAVVASAGIIPPLVAQVGISSGTRLFFIADNGSAGPELWSTTTGTPLTTAITKDIYPGATGGPVPSFGIATLPGNKVVFAADDSVNGIEPWVSDGTLIGTKLISDINNAAAAGSIAPPTEATTFDRVDNFVFFQANNGVADYEGYRTDGTTTGTSMLAEANPTGAGDPLWFSKIGGKLIFAANNGLNGFELMYEDTVLVNNGTSGGGGAGSGSGGGSSGGSGSGGGGGGGAIDLTILAGLAALALSRRRWKLH